MTPLQVPAGEIGNDDANELADEILLRGEFLGSREPGFFSRSVNRVLEWIGNLLDRIFSTIFGGSGAGAGAAIAYILLAVAIVIVAIALIRAIRNRRADRDTALDATARIVFDEVVDPDELRADLASLRAAQDWRGAVVAAFRLAIVALIEQGIALERPGATTGDFGRAVERNRADLVADYRRAADSFERAFYSDAPITEADQLATAALLERLDRVPA